MMASSGYFADLFISMQSMLTHRRIGLHSIVPIAIADESLQTRRGSVRHSHLRDDGPQWDPEAEAEKSDDDAPGNDDDLNDDRYREHNHGGAHETFTAAQRVLQSAIALAATDEIPSTERILAWAQAYAQKATSEAVARYMRDTYERLDLRPGDGRINACWKPFENDRPRTVLNSMRGTRYAEALAAKMSVGPQRILSEGEDTVNTSLIAAAVLFKVCVYAHQNIDGKGLPMDSACLIFEDMLEEMGDEILTLRPPLLVQLQGMWAVVLDGHRTAYAPYTDSQRVWMATGLLLERSGSAMFRVSGLIAEIKQFQ